MSGTGGTTGIKRWIGIGGAGIVALFARIGCHGAEEAVKLAKPAIIQAAEHGGSLADDAAKAAIHGVGSIGEDAAKVAGHSAISAGKGAGEHAAAALAEKAGEKGGKTGIGLMKTGAKRTGDAENIARNAVNVARGEIRRRARQKHDHSQDSKKHKPHAKPASRPRG